MAGFYEYARAIHRITESQMWHEEEYLSIEDYIVQREGFYPSLFLIQSCFHSF
jgi:hypothetical protein